MKSRRAKQPVGKRGRGEEWGGMYTLDKLWEPPFQLTNCAPDSHANSAWSNQRLLTSMVGLKEGQKCCLQSKAEKHVFGIIPIGFGKN